MIRGNVFISSPPPFGYTMKLEHRRMLFQAVAGVFVLLGSLVIYEFDGWITGMLASIIFFGLPGIYLMRRSSEMHSGEVDIPEMLSMMASGALVFMFLSIVTVSIMLYGVNVPTLGAIALSFVIFFLPAWAIWVYNSKRRTDVYEPRSLS